MRPSTLLSLLVLATSAVAGPSGQPKDAGTGTSIKNLKDKIKNVVVVVMVMENRSFDHLLGGQKIKGLSNPINDGPFCNPYNMSDLSLGYACSKPIDYDEIPDNPDYEVYGNNMEFYGYFTPNNTDIAVGNLVPHMQGFVQEQLRMYKGSTYNTTFLANSIMNYYTEEQVPVITALTNEFVVFNHWHGDIPGPTNVNRVALTSGTSYGRGTNNFNYGSMSQMSIFQKLNETGYSTLDYVDSADIIDMYFYNWTYNKANNRRDMVVDISQFFTDAAAGKLPDFTFINPSCCSVGTKSMHPPSLISDGESFLKEVYEALRASPQWDNLLFIVTFDESGGFHDHVPPPRAVRPDNLTYTESTPNGTYIFEFDRLGGRLPTWLISPWVAKGHVEQYGTNSDRETVSYSATSILRTLGYLWDFEPFTPRVEKAPSFDHLILSHKRDTPMTLPNVTTV